MAVFGLWSTNTCSRLLSLATFLSAYCSGSAAMMCLGASHLIQFIQQQQQQQKTVNLNCRNEWNAKRIKNATHWMRIIVASLCIESAFRFVIFTRMERAFFSSFDPIVIRRVDGDSVWLVIVDAISRVCVCVCAICMLGHWRFLLRSIVIRRLDLESLSFDRRQIWIYDQLKCQYIVTINL